MTKLLSLSAVVFLVASTAPIAANAQRAEAGRAGSQIRERYNGDHTAATDRQRGDQNGGQRDRGVPMDHSARAPARAGR